jgi:hypothetical protein
MKIEHFSSKQILILMSYSLFLSHEWFVTKLSLVCDNFSFAILGEFSLKIQKILSSP